MKATIRGLAYVLGDNIDTDQIIPAAHLVYSLSKPDEKRMYGRYALSGVPSEQAGLPQGHLPYTEADAYTSQYAVIIGGSNFGCGSSREHAPFALQEAGCEAVVAESYARIFYRNAVDGGFVVPFESEQPLAEVIRTGDEVEIDTARGILTNHTTGQEHLLKPLGEVAGIIRAGGLFAFARQTGMIAG